MSGNYQESGAMLSKRLPRVNECNRDLSTVIVTVQEHARLCKRNRGDPPMRNRDRGRATVLVDLDLACFSGYLAFYAFLYHGSQTVRSRRRF